jgi:hypothetical protein
LLKDAQKQLIIEGRMRMSKDFGSGRLEIIEEARSHLSFVDREEGSAI